MTSDQSPNEVLRTDQLGEDEFDWPRLLGEKHTELAQGAYTATFTGSGFVTSDYDEGTFLSSLSFAARHRLPATKYWQVRRLEMGDLFPKEWQGKSVEYEITVQARRRKRASRAQTQP